MAAPPEKKQKTDDEEAKDAKLITPPKPPEPPKELEEDAKPLKGGKAADAVEFLQPDTTVNLMPSVDGSLLMSLQDSGFSHLLAGARASVGVKSGRYMFEVKIVECPGTARSLLKIGFSVADSSLLLDSDEASVSFDSDGQFSGTKSGKKMSQKLNGGNVVACLLNLEKGSPNCNTISLFNNGRRIAQPQALPESLQGKVLFPTVAFKCMTLHTNFGPEPLCPLPFTCHMVGSALKSHAEVKTSAPEAGEVIFPVSLPDEGSFDWLDMFLEKNPGYVEISDRAIRDWAEKSWSGQKRGFVPKSSNDKPEMGFGVPKLDDGWSVKKMLTTFCALQKRSAVVMEVKGNLVKEERAAALETFKSAGIKTSAMVVVGDPPAEFKKRSQGLLLKQKQETSNKEHHDKFVAEKKKWQFTKKQKELEKSRKKAAKEKEKAAKAKAKAQAKALEEAKKKALAAKEGEEKKEENKDEEEKKEEPEKEEEEPEEEEPEEEEEAEEPEPMEEDPPVVTLTDEEKKLAFRPSDVPDLTQYVLNTTFTKFSLPDKEEGFGEIKYGFLKDGAKCAKFVEDWVSARKLTTRVEDVTPSPGFFTKKKAFDKAVNDWHAAASKYKSLLAKKRADKAAKEAKKKQAAVKAAAAKAKAEAEKKKKEEEEKKDGEKEEEKKEEEKEEAQEVEEEEEEAEEPEIDIDDVDVFGCDDVNDVGGGMPLCNFFTPTDWALMALSFELHLLVHSFKTDVKDDTRAGIHVDHLDFYYQKYFQKALTPKSFGVETVQAIVDLVKDVVYIDGKGKLVTCLAEEMESYQIFVKITEEARRYRSLCIDAGDESAVLKISVQHGSQQYQNSHKRKQDWKDWKDWKQPQAGAGGKGSSGKGPIGKGSWGQSGQSWGSGQNKRPKWVTK